MNRLKELRTARGLTIRALEEKVGISHTQITHIENGKRNFTTKNAKIVAEFFGVSVDYLLGKSPDEMLADFASSIDQNWRTVSFDAAGEPTQVYSSGVSRPLQLKFDILRLLNETDDEAVLCAAYEYFRSCVVPREFLETPEQELSHAERIQQVAKIVKLLFAMDSAALDLILQTAALQKRQG